jgi:hypothetical protein
MKRVDEIQIMLAHGHDGAGNDEVLTEPCSSQAEYSQSPAP